MSCVNVTVLCLPLVGRGLRMWPFQIMICNGKLSFWILKMYKEEKGGGGEEEGGEKKRRRRRK